MEQQQDSSKQIGSKVMQRTGSSSSGGTSSAATSSIGANLRLKQSALSSFFAALCRKKPLDCRTDTSLNRCLNLIDLIALGVGSTLGLGLYVLAGQVASNKAGPGVVISFALAALASAFSALCYAEFAGRVPKAGSAYAYSYITVGEFVAFVIGWNLILEYVIGTASVARGFSGYLCFIYDHVHSLLVMSVAQSPTGGAANQHQQSGLSLSNTTTLLNSTMGHLTKSVLKIGLSANATINPLVAAPPWYESIIDYLETYFDWPSVGIIAVITIFILFGVKGSTNVTLAFTLLNLLVVGVMVISSIKSLDLHNWRLSKSEVPLGYGEGGFLPYGWSGVLAGSATCFFGFIGFDTIASSAEEAKNPKRNVPLSILLSLFISFITYMSVAIVQTLLWPYYDQNKVTILPYVFGRLDMPITYWIVLLGAVAGLASSQLGGMYPLPRILYSMAHDKLIYGYLAHVNQRLKLPVRATIVGSVFVALLSCLLDIQDLADMVSIGTLAAYSLVSLSVLILRYEDRGDSIDDCAMINDLNLADIISTMEQSEGGNTLQPVPYGDQNKIRAKASIQNGEKSSKALSPQLSAGFQNWLKKSDPAVVAAAPTYVLSPINTKRFDETCRMFEQPNQKDRSFLDLLITRKAHDQIQNRRPDKESSKQSKTLIGSLVVLTIIFDIVVLGLTNMPSDSDTQTSLDRSVDDEIAPSSGKSFSIDPKLLLGSTGCIVAVILAAIMLMLARLPNSRTSQSDMFQVPLVPLIPFLSILVNTFLMLNLSYLTWIRFTVWMAIGLFIYFTYGIWKSRGFLS